MTHEFAVAEKYLLKLWRRVSVFIGIYDRGMDGVGGFGPHRAKWRALGVVRARWPCGPTLPLLFLPQASWVLRAHRLVWKNNIKYHK